MEIYIEGKTTKINTYKTVSRFTKTVRNILNILAHDKIERQNCVIGNFNVVFFKNCLQN